MYRIGQEEIAELTKTIESRSMFKVNNGMKQSEKVEEKLRTLFDVQYSIFVTSGHAALTSALIAFGIGPGSLRRSAVPGSMRRPEALFSR